MMNRRNAVKNLVIASGGLITLPFWMEACRLSDKTTHPSSFSPAEQEILAKTIDTIIPAGPSPGFPAAKSPGSSAGTVASIGALSVGVDKYLQKMLDDCYEKPVRDNVQQQLLALDESAKHTYGSPFTVCSLQQRQTLLLKCQNSQHKDEKDFFNLLKSETIRGFNTAQKVMEDYYYYQVAPGHYYGCVNVKTQDHAG